MPNNPEPGQAERIARRRARVFDLRTQGMTIRQITDQWNLENPTETIGKTQIHKDLQHEMEELASQTTQKASHVRELITAKLDHLYSRKKFQQRIEQGDLGTYDRAIKMIQEYAKLYGAYSPTKIAQTDSEGNDVGKMTEEERAVRVMELLETARRRALENEPENREIEEVPDDEPVPPSSEVMSEL